MIVNNSDEYYMRQALKEAKAAFDDDEIPVGAIVVLDNTIIGRGRNQVERLQDPTAHAEMIALTAAFGSLGAKYLPEATLYVTVEPCAMCAGALYWSKIGRVVFGASDEKNGSINKLPFKGQTELTPFHPKTLVTQNILNGECTQLMKLFFQQKRGK